MEPDGLVPPPESDDLPRAGRETVRGLQDAALRRLVARTWAGNRFYRRLWERAGADPERVRTVEDLRRLPLVRREDLEADLRANPPFGTYQGELPLCRIQASSGSTGQPKPFGLTRTDWENGARLWARRLAAQGVRPGDRVHLAFTYSLFIAGFGATEGAMRLGTMALPLGSGASTPSRRQLELARSWGSTVLGCTGSYAVHLAEVAEAEGLDPARDFSFRVMFHTAEPLPGATRSLIQRRWGVRAYDNYGSVESGGAPTWECRMQDGLHINEDAFVFEIVDPASLEPLPDGEEGVLVMTTLLKEASPCIRYLTGDVTRLIPEPCPCGCTFRRMAPVRARVDDMVKVRGVTVFPTAVESVLRRFPQLGGAFRLVVDREGSLDRLVVEVEVAAGGAAAEGPGPAGAPDELIAQVRAALRDTLGMQPDVALRPPGGVLPPGDAETLVKSRRLVDRRTPGATRPGEPRDPQAPKGVET